MDPATVTQLINATLEAEFPRFQAARRAASVLRLAGIVVAVGALGYTTWRVAGNEATISEQQRILARNDSLVRRDSVLLQRLVPAALRAYGWRGDSLAGVLARDTLLVAQSVRALESIPTVRERVEAAGGRRALARDAVVYFAKDTTRDLNRRLFIQSVRDMGFPVTLRTPLNDVPSNAVWYGDSVPVDHVRLVALGMLRSGYRLQQVARYPTGEPGRAHTIQIGANWTLRDAPLLSADVVLHAGTFAADTTPRGVIPGTMQARMNMAPPQP